MTSSVHFLNVKPGASTIIQHSSGRVSMIDICNARFDKIRSKTLTAALFQGERPRGDFKMGQSLTNPINYLKSLNVNSIWRFILTHPDMDHMDGLKLLMDNLSINHFWHTSVHKAKPDFSGSPYCEEDWNAYANIINGKSKDITILNPLAGDQFVYANKGDNVFCTGDNLHILAPSKDLFKDSDINNSSYIILFENPAGKILFPGDAHDASWEYVLERNQKAIQDCAFLLAPHHGRDSKRSYEFLDHIRPQLTLFGNASSEHLAYEEWQNRNLDFITTNQVGNTVLEVDCECIKVFIENKSFAQAKGLNISVQNKQGYVFYKTLKTFSKKPASTFTGIADLLKLRPPSLPEQLRQSVLSNELPAAQQKSNFLNELFGKKY
ncbi:MAG: ComEC/Rec2 family competence protein [Parachlamydiaceae bacterium]